MYRFADCNVKLRNDSLLGKWDDDPYFNNKVSLLDARLLLALLQSPKLASRLSTKGVYLLLEGVAMNGYNFLMTLKPVSFYPLIVTHRVEPIKIAMILQDITNRSKALVLFFYY